MAYGARLESVLGESPRGFESPILRQPKIASDLVLVLPESSGRHDQPVYHWLCRAKEVRVPVSRSARPSLSPDDGIIGSVVGGRYRVTSLIGRGGMATVYRAVDQSLPREVAL